MSAPVDQIVTSQSLDEKPLVGSHFSHADINGYMSANRRLKWSFIVMGMMWFFSALIFWLASHETFHTTKPSQTVPWVQVPEINPAEVSVNVTTLLLLVASLNVALVVSEIGAPVVKTAFQARWAEVTEYINYGAAVFSLLLTTTVFFWNMHTFVLCVPMSVLTAILAASAYQRSGGYVHRLAFEKRIAEAALRSINARLASGAQRKDFSWRSLTLSGALLVLTPPTAVLMVQLLATVITPEAAWKLGVAPAIAAGLSSLSLSITRVVTVNSWEAGRRIGSFCGWLIGGGVALLVTITPISLATEGAGFMLVAVIVVPPLLHVLCLIFWRRANAGPWRALHQICRRHAMANVRAARKAFESAH